MIGSALVREFTSRGVEVRPLVRHAPRDPNELAWDIDAGTIDAAKLEGVGAVIHLAGENLAQRWSSEIKQKIRDSRVKSTTLLARTLASLTTKPAVLLSGSAIGIYGSRGDEMLDESSPLGDDFLAEVCKVWEAASARMPEFVSSRCAPGWCCRRMLVYFRNCCCRSARASAESSAAESSG